ncbi:MAG: hypothetical protein ACK41U_12985 [Paracoccus sp. (in: a-proteobacteria)]
MRKFMEHLHIKPGTMIHKAKIRSDFLDLFPAVASKDAENLYKILIFIANHETRRATKMDRDTISARWSLAPT